MRNLSSLFGTHRRRALATLGDLTWSLTMLVAAAAALWLCRVSIIDPGPVLAVVNEQAGMGIHTGDLVAITSGLAGIVAAMVGVHGLVSCVAMTPLPIGTSQPRHPRR